MSYPSFEAQPTQVVQPFVARIRWAVLGSAIAMSAFVVAIFFSLLSPNNLEAAPAATTVWGQSDLNSAVQLPTADNTIGIPNDVLIANGHLLVLDTDSNRLMIWNSIEPATQGPSADSVLGQPDFTTASVNGPTGVADAGTFNSPGGIHYDGSNLYVADSGNNRVLVWSNINLDTPAATADIILGQTDPAMVGSASGATGLSSPSSVFVQGNNVYVVDSGNHRVLVYTRDALVTGAAATAVIGQPDLNSNSANAGNGSANQFGFDSPIDIYVSNNTLAVTDMTNNRVMIWYNNIMPDITTGASVVLGQPDFTSNFANQGASTPSLSSLFQPTNIAIAGGHVYVSDTGNHRVVVWNTGTPQTNDPVDAYIGQSTPSDSGVNAGAGLFAPTNQSLAFPLGLYGDGDRLYVADQFNRRVVRFPGVLFPPLLSLIDSDSTSANISIGTNQNPPGTTYSISVLAIDGNVSSEIVLQGGTLGNGNIVSNLHPAGTLAITELTPNSQYILAGRSVNTSVDQEFSSLSQALNITTVSTPAAVPLNFTAVAGGDTIIKTAWEANGNPDGTVYEVAYEDGAPVATTTNLFYDLTGLSPNTNLTLKVRAENADGNGYSDYSNTASAQTTGGSVGGGGSGGGGRPAGGGGSSNNIIAPSGTIAINGGDETTISREVTIIIDATNTTHIALANDENGFVSGSEVELPESRRLSWTLTEGNGVKTVCAQFRKEGSNNFDVSCDTIILEESNLTCSLDIGQVYKKPNSPTIYQIVRPFDENMTQCTKRVFENEDKYFSYYTGWDDIEVVSDATLEAIPTDRISIIPWGPKYNPYGLSIVKTLKNPRLYYLYNGQKFWFNSSTVFSGLGYQTNWVMDVDESFLNQYTVAEEIDTIANHPDGTLIQYAGNSDIYKLENGKKRLIPSRFLFNKLGFSSSRVITIDPSEQYDMGVDISIREIFSQRSRMAENIVFKYANSQKIYKLEGGKARYITHESVFAILGLRWNEIITLQPIDFNYPDGAPIHP